MKKLITYLLMLPLLLVSCQENGIDSVPAQENSASNSTELKLMKINIEKSLLYKKSSKKNGDFVNQVAAINEVLLEHGIQLEKMEFLGAEEVGNTVYFKNVGNKQLASDFVPNDPRNWWPSNPYLGEWMDGTVGYWTDGTQQGTSSGMSENETIDAFESVMNTWGSINCSQGLVLSNQGVTSDADFGDVGYVQWLTGFGGYPGIAPGSILHGGNLPAFWFEAVLGSTDVLGVTFTFVWTGTDLDQNGKADVAIKEIYMNDGFAWQDAPNDVLGNGIYDYETVLLHEAGHGLSQGHFGKAFRDNGPDGGKLHFTPHALMNAGYTVGRRDITGTDEAGHCSIWENWPNE